MEMCKWYTVDYEGGCTECDIANEETSCHGDTGRCESEQLRQSELKAEAIDFKADADRENSR